MKDCFRAFILTLLVVLAGELFHHPFFFRDDQQAHLIPGFAEVARAWRAGEWPLLTPFSWCSGCFVGEYQYAIFNPLVQVPVIISSFLQDLAWRSAFLVLIFSWMTLWGALRLGKIMGLDDNYALAFAVAFCFNRYSLEVGWRAWLPMAIGSVWIPWFWSACAGPRLSLMGLVLSLTLVLTAGWPFAVVMVASLGVYYFILALLQRRQRRAALLVLGAVCALLLSAPSLGCLLEYAQSALRDRRSSSLYSLGILDGLTYFLPGLNFNSKSMEQSNLIMNIGWIPCLGIWGALSQRKLRSSLWWLALIWFVLAVSPSFAGMRFSSRWQQYLNPLMAMLGLQWLQRQERSHRFGLLVIGGLTLAQLLGPAIDALNQVKHRWELGPPLLLLVFVAAWNHWPLLRSRLVLAATLAGLFVSFTPQSFNGHEYPIANISQDTLVDRQHTWLTLYTWRELQSTNPQITVFARYGNSALYQKIKMVNGYSPLFATKLIWCWTFSNVGSLDTTDWAINNIALGCEPGGLMEKLGITGLLVSPDWRGLEPLLQKTGWQKIGQEGLVHIWTRPGTGTVLFESVPEAVFRQNWQENASIALEPNSLPVIQLQGHKDGKVSYARLNCSNPVEQRNRAVVDVSANPSEQAALIALHRPWVAGYRAYFNGKSLPVAVMNLAQMAVEIPAASPGGRLEVVYCPVAWQYAPLFLFLAAVLGLVGWKVNARYEPEGGVPG